MMGGQRGGTLHRARRRFDFGPDAARIRSAVEALAWTAAVLLLIALPLSGLARAGNAACDGPAECCPQQTVQRLPSKTTVQVGVVVLGISDINERGGTWDADFYLYERWPPISGFTPQTELVNESQRRATQFDTTELRDGLCERSRRIRSTLRTTYNLRAFPFDQQRLLLELSDDEFNTSDVVYSVAPQPLGFGDGVREAVSGWKVEGDLTFARGGRAFVWEKDAPQYDYATVNVTVRRHVTFHLTKYFLPLFVIVFLAFSVFWIDADDLGSQVTIGVTCVLAAIAFQLAEAASLPAVDYLTLADRVYADCYVAIGLAVLQTIYSNGLARRWKRSSRSAGSRSSLARGIEGAIPVPLATGASSS
jgi:hypothetical protein